ncbi:tRNA (cytidine(34)-2'-O)-methyltransferase [Isoalcanivorax indicus]|uniref:tRNA (cytidine(34)-2'-O)-methyltransferase n=1 Tax=Isoalcanivorax indicus TaxID=2202653 RepID=UPI000DBA7B5E|nr:tRNA (cytidine(34)-2'-O)-methyltransferase [Isoalcanivorax indicus]
MLHIALYQPEIPPNTGNIMRLAANTGCQLHLIEPLGFSLDDKLLRRAGLDYRDQATVTRHADWEAFSVWRNGRRLWALSTKASHHYAQARFAEDDVLLFGPESRGLPEALFMNRDDVLPLRLPMLPGSRSLNLSNAVTATVYEAWRQLGFVGGI